MALASRPWVGSYPTGRVVINRNAPRSVAPATSGQRSRGHDSTALPAQNRRRRDPPRDRGRPPGPSSPSFCGRSGRDARPAIGASPGAIGVAASWSGCSTAAPAFAVSASSAIGVMQTECPALDGMDREKTRARPRSPCERWFTLSRREDTSDLAAGRSGQLRGRHPVSAEAPSNATDLETTTSAIPSTAARSPGARPVPSLRPRTRMNRHRSRGDRGAGSACGSVFT